MLGLPQSRDMQSLPLDGDVLLQARAMCDLEVFLDTSVLQDTLVASLFIM